MRLRVRVGPLAERDVRLLFSATMVTTVGDRLGAIVLAFAGGCTSTTAAVEA